MPAMQCTSSMTNASAVGENTPTQNTAVNATISTTSTLAAIAAADGSGSDADNVTNKDSNGYRTLLQGAGEQSITVTCDGTADSAAAFSTLENNFFSNTISTYSVFFDNGDTLECYFQITSFDVSGAYNKEQLFSATLEFGSWFTEVSRRTLKQAA